MVEGGIRLPGHGDSLLARLGALLLAIWLLGWGPPVAAQQTEEPAQRLVQARWLDAPEGARTVDLPFMDFPFAPRGSAPVAARFELGFDAPVMPRGRALYITGLLAQARIAVNGEVVYDHWSATPPRALPRSSDAIVLVEVPDRAWRTGRNELRFDLRGTSWLSLSPVVVGPQAELSAVQRWRVLAVVVGPAAVAVVVACLGLAVLLLYSRRREALYGCFGAGALGWALHSLWTVLPWRLLPPPHFGVWWHTLYTFFVLMMVVFCLRFAGPPWPRLERATPWGIAAVVPLLHAADALDFYDEVASLLRLGLIALVAVGVWVVARHALARRNVESLLILASGAAGLGFGVFDWARGYVAPDNHPVYLVPYAALLFVVTVAWILIDRFVRSAQQIEQFNRELEQRVQAQNAELSRTLAQVQAARDRAEAADRAKTSFLAAASHDLRQPVHALGLYLAALKAEPLAAGPGELVGRMSRSLDALEEMFDALLDISRMDAGAVVPQPRPFELAPLLRRLADAHAPLAEERGLRLSLHLPPPQVDRRALSDPLLVERILGNLLVNAVRYTRSGGVLLAARWRALPQPHWRVEVFDTGRGIAEAERERIWEEFYQVGNPERDRSAGLGLGLSIVRRLTDLLQLPILLRSRPGRGTRFELQLPATAAPEQAAPVHGAGVLRPGLRVAVLEDDLEVRDAMQRLLRQWGCQVGTAADAATLLAADAAPAEAVVADWRLRDGRDGAAEARTLFERWGRRVPLLVVTGETSPATLALIRAQGLPCLPKPVAPEALRQWLAAAAP